MQASRRGFGGWAQVQGGVDVIRKEAWSLYRTISGVRLCWELEEPKGPRDCGAGFGGRHRIVRVQEAAWPERRGENVVGPDLRVADLLHQGVHAVCGEGSEQQVRECWICVGRVIDQSGFGVSKRAPAD